MSPRKAAALREVDVTLRDHLIATAERLIAEGGTADLTVRAIARAAGVADGVLYNYFADKEELLAQALNAHVRTVAAGLGELPLAGAGSVEDNLRTHVAYGLAFHRAVLPAFAGLIGRPKVLAAFADLDEGEHWRDRLRDYLAGERDLGRLALDARVDSAAAMIIGVCHEVVLAGLLQAPSAEPDIDDLVATIIKGIAPAR